MCPTLGVIVKSKNPQLAVTEQQAADSPYPIDYNDEETCRTYMVFACRVLLSALPILKLEDAEFEAAMDEPTKAHAIVQVLKMALFDQECELTRNDIRKKLIDRVMAAGAARKSPVLDADLNAYIDYEVVPSLPGISAKVLNGTRVM
jgi:hypothetical protein